MAAAMRCKKKNSTAGNIAFLTINRGAAKKIAGIDNLLLW